MGYRRNIQYDRVAGVYRVRKQWRGKVYKQTLSTRANAERWLEKLERRLLDLPGGETDLLLGDAARMYLRRLHSLNRAPATVTYYSYKFEALVRHWGKAMPLAHIEQRHVNEYADRRQEEGVSSATINYEMSCLARLYKMPGHQCRPTWTWERLSHSPRERLVRSPEEIGRIWKHLSQEARVPCGLCLFAALRAAEAFRAEPEWVRRDQRELWVMARKMRDPMKTALVDTLADLLPADGALIRTTPAEVDKELRRACRTEKIKPALRGPGVLRHHAATWGVEYSDGRFSLEDARLVLGHQTGGVTARYVRSQTVKRKRDFLEVVEGAWLGYVLGTPDGHKWAETATSGPPN